MTEIGWCHQCGTLQLWSEAPLLVPPWEPEDAVPEPCCAVCGADEPWCFSVFPVENQALVECARAHHVTWDPTICESCATGRDLRDTWIVH